MSKFDVRKCAIPTVWCGKGRPPKSKDLLMRYTRVGTGYECLKKGIGVGCAKSKKTTGLQGIKYVGPVYEAAFKKNKISSVPQLRAYVKSHSVANVESLLKKCLKKKDGKVDYRAYNSILVMLYLSGINKLPSCSKIK